MAGCTFGNTCGNSYRCRCAFVIQLLVRKTRVCECVEGVLVVAARRSHRPLASRFLQYNDKTQRYTSSFFVGPGCVSQIFSTANATIVIILGVQAEVPWSVGCPRQPNASCSADPTTPKAKICEHSSSSVHHVCLSKLCWCIRLVWSTHHDGIVALRYIRPVGRFNKPNVQHIP